MLKGHPECFLNRRHGVQLLLIYFLFPLRQRHQAVFPEDVRSVQNSRLDCEGLVELEAVKKDQVALGGFNATGVIVWDTQSQKENVFPYQLLWLTY